MSLAVEVQSLDHWTTREVGSFYFCRRCLQRVRGGAWKGLGGAGLGRASLVAQMVKNLPAMWETLVQPLGQEDPLEKAMPTHPSILAWRIPWTEESGGLQSRGCQLTLSLGNRSPSSRALASPFQTPELGLYFLKHTPKAQFCTKTRSVQDTVSQPF